MKTSTPTILVIDDDASIRTLFARLLQRLGYRSLFAADGADGLRQVGEASPDLVVSDLYMPGMDGFAVLEAMGRSDPEIPVVVLSGAGDRDAVIRALRLGAWDYLPKPAENLDLLRNTLGKALERARLLRENRRYQQELERLVAAKTAALQASEVRFRTMADFAYDWECWIAPDREVIYTSPSCRRITGYSAGEFKARPELMIEIVHADDRAAVAQHYTEAGSREDRTHIDFRIVTRSGEIRWISHNCRPVLDPAGRFLGRRMSNRDITRRKHFERDLEMQRQALMENSRHLEKANHALKAMLDHREIERQSIEASFLTRLKRHVFPYIEQLEALSLAPKARSFLQIIRTNIEELVTPMNPTLSTAYQSLTPVETTVADLIRLGKGTKEIASLQNVSPRTVAIHRNKIRRKLGLVNSKTNLQAYLKSLN